MDHPAVIEIMRTGYAEKEPEFYGEDQFGREVYKGDEILKIDDSFFRVRGLHEEAIEALEIVGAEYQTA